MKKLNYFLLGLAALGMVFTSCEDDEALGPEITFKAGDGLITGDETVKVGETASFSWEAIKGDAKLTSFTIRIDNQDVDGFPKTDIDKDEYQSTWAMQFLEAGTYAISFIVEDKDGMKASKTITVTVEASTTPLGSEKTFSLTYKGSSQSDGANENATVGIKYQSNTGGSTAKFATMSGEFVKIEEADYTSIENKEALLAKFAAGTTISDFTAESDAKFKAVYFISKVGDKYFLVKMTSLKFSAGNNKAEFAYKE